jgi:hypothetical protein
VANWPRNAQGKLNRAILLRLAQEQSALGRSVPG